MAQGGVPVGRSRILEDALRAGVGHGEDSYQICQTGTPYESRDPGSCRLEPVEHNARKPKPLDDNNSRQGVDKHVRTAADVEGGHRDGFVTRNLGGQEYTEKR